jgi:uncharacterized protein with HEPN domain
VKKGETRDYLNDIQESIIDIGNFISGMKFESFKEDKKTIYAVVHCIEIIGEASLKIPGPIKEKYARVPWIQMSGMLNKITLGIFRVDISLLWQTVQEDIPILKSYMRDISSEIKGDHDSSQSSPSVS